MSKRLFKLIKSIKKWWNRMWSKDIQEPFPYSLYPQSFEDPFDDSFFDEPFGM